MAKFLQGIWQDGDPIDQPEGKYRNAKNALLTKKIGAVSSEEGTTSRASIPTGYEIIGNVLVYDGLQVLFLVNGSGDSEIASFDGSTYTVIINDTDITDGGLNFSSESTIEAIAVVNDNNETVVYWTDGINPPRFINIDTNYTASIIIDDPDELNIFPTFENIINATLSDVNDFGGNLITGIYQFAFSYIDSDGNQTNYQFVTKPVHITDSSEEGAIENTSTAKSIELDISNIDTDYSSLQIAVIHQSGGSIQSVRELTEINISNSTFTFTYTGQETFTEGSLNEILIDQVTYKTAKYITQQDGVLYMGNLSKNVDIGFQPYANNIKIELVKDTLDTPDDGDEGFHYTVPLTAYQKKSFRRGGVYAFYISFILKDGTETYAYHIPGREAETNGDGDLETLAAGSGTSDSNETDFANFADSKKFHYEARNGSFGFGFWENAQETYPNNDNFDVYDVNSSGVAVDPGGGNLGDTDIRNQKVRHHRIPENIHLPFYNTGDANPFSVTGIKIRDVKLTTEIYNQVKAFKIYHAEVTEDNEMVLGQGLLIPQKDYSEGGEDYHTNDLPSNPDSSTINTDVFAVHDFRLLRTLKNISSLAYIKNFSDAGNDDEGFDVPDDAGSYTAKLFPTSYLSRDSALRLRRIVGNAKSYIESNIGETNITARGFDHDKRSTLEESQLVMRLEDNLSKNISVGSVDLDYTWLTTLHAFETELYNAFDQQQLVWTGFIETDMDSYYPPNITAGAAATGSIEITGAGSGAVNASVQPGFSGTVDTSGTIKMTADKVGYTFPDILIPILATDSLAQVVDKVVDEINNSANFSADAGVGGDGDFTVSVKDPIGSDGNNISISFFDNDDDDQQFIGSLILDGPDSTANGSDGFLGFTINGIRELYFNIPASSTTTAVANGLRDYMNNNSGKYEATVNTGGANPVVEITSKFNSTSLNGAIEEEINEGGATHTITDMDNGTDPSNVTGAIFGGDTYLGYFGYRTTNETDAGGSIETKVIFRIPVECKDNVSLRHTGDDFGEDNVNLESLWADILDWEEDGENDYYDNFYGYDQSYSFNGIVRPAFPFPKNLSGQTDSFPTRVIRSQANTPSAVGNNLRVFLEEDFLDFPRQRGQITNLAINDNNLLVHMERGLFLTRGREEFISGDIRAYVGSGDIFAIKPDELKSTDAGFGGQLDQRAAITTPYGYFFVDRKAGEVFLIGSQESQKISDLGLKNFFNSELRGVVNERELIAAWDDKWDRIILTYLGNDTDEGPWTLSYYPQLQAWGSFHTYTPSYYLSGLATFYSINNEAIHEHNISTVAGSFYGTAQPLEFEFVDNREPLQTKVISNLQFVSEVEDASTGVRDDDATFDQFRIVTKRHDTGDQNITVFQSLSSPGNARNAEGTWRINKFRDLLVNGSIDTDKPQKDQSQLYGKYAQVKLTYLHSSNKFIYLHNAMAGMRTSYR